MLNKEQEKLLEILTRDITKVGSIPKSEIRRRIENLLKEQSKEFIKMVEKYEPFVRLTKDWAERKKIERELKKYKDTLLINLKNL